MSNFGKIFKNLPALSLILYASMAWGAFVYAHFTWSVLTPWSAAFGLILTLSFLFLMKPSGHQNSNISVRLFCGLWIVGLVTRFYNIIHYPVWADEVIHNGLIFHDRDTFRASLIANQPPTFYYLSIFSHAQFPQGPLQLRFFSAFFGALSVPLFFVCLKSFVRSPLVIVFGIIAFVLEPSLLAFAKEGKPYGIGLFMAVAFLYSLGEKCPWRRFAIALLFLFSLGMQPPVLLTVFLIAFACFCFFEKQSGRLLFAFPWLMAGTLYAPFFFKLMEFSPSSFSPSKGATLWQRFESLVVEYPTLLTDLDGKSPANYLMVFVSVSLLLLSTIWRPQPFRWLMVSAVAFPILLHKLFHLSLSEIFWGRYLVIGLPLFMLVVAILLDRLGRLLPVGIVALIVVLIKPYSENRFTVENKWKDLYEYLRNEKVKEGEGFLFTINSYKNYPYSYNGFLGLNYYYDEELKRKIRLVPFDAQPFETQNQIRYLLDRIATGAEPPFIYLFSPLRESQGDFRNYRFSVPVEFVLFPESHGEWSAVLLKIPNRIGFRKTMNALFKSIAEQEKDFDLTVRPTLFLLGTALQVGDCKGASVYLNRVRDYAFSLKVRQDFFLHLVHDFEEKGCHRIGSRIEN